VPLINDNTTVGVLVVWSHQIQPTRASIKHLESFAQLAAAHISIQEKEHQRGLILHKMQHIMATLQKNTRLSEKINQILQGVIVAGFDRARIYNYLESDRAFECIDTIGMTCDQNMRGMKVYFDQNPYAYDTVLTALQNPSARVYDPTDPAFWGKDPSATLLEKAENLPWAVVPLVISGRLYGQIVADNAVSHHDISAASLDFLSHLGGLAAQALESEWESERLNAILIPVKKARGCMNRIKDQLSGGHLLSDELTSLILEASEEMNKCNL
jgi:hypothetical protein